MEQLTFKAVAVGDSSLRRSFHSASMRRLTIGVIVVVGFVLGSMAALVLPHTASRLRSSLPPDRFIHARTAAPGPVTRTPKRECASCPLGSTPAKFVFSASPGPLGGSRNFGTCAGCRPDKGYRVPVCPCGIDSSCSHHTRKLWDFPKFVAEKHYSPFPQAVVKLLNPQSLGSCAIVGSSSILLGSGFGEEIDAHDTVWRANVQRPALHTVDVGSRTDLLSLNANHYPVRELSRYWSIPGFIHKTQLDQPAMVLVTAKREAPDVLAELGRRGLNATFISIDDFVASVLVDFKCPLLNDHFPFNATAFGKKAFCAVGAMGEVTALIAQLICREVHLYGFWGQLAMWPGSPAPPVHYYAVDGVFPNNRPSGLGSQDMGMPFLLRMACLFPDRLVLHV